MQIPLFGTRYHSFTRKIFISLRWAFLDPLRIVSSYLTGSQEVLTENFAREGVEKDSPSTAPSNYSLQLRLRRSLSLSLTGNFKSRRNENRTNDDTNTTRVEKRMEGNSRRHKGTLNFDSRQRDTKKTIFLHSRSVGYLCGSHSKRVFQCCKRENLLLILIGQVNYFPLCQELFFRLLIFNLLI